MVAIASPYVKIRDVAPGSLYVDEDGLWAIINPEIGRLVQMAKARRDGSLRWTAGACVKSIDTTATVYLHPGFGIYCLIRVIEVNPQNGILGLIQAIMGD